MLCALFLICSYNSASCSSFIPVKFKHIDSLPPCLAFEPLPSDVFECLSFSIYKMGVTNPLPLRWVVKIEWINIVQMLRSAPGTWWALDICEWVLLLSTLGSGLWRPPQFISLLWFFCGTRIYVLILGLFCGSGPCSLPHSLRELMLSLTHSKPFLSHSPRPLPCFHDQLSHAVLTLTIFKVWPWWKVLFLTAWPAGWLAGAHVVWMLSTG